MKLYIANGQYVGTQAEAKAITKSFKQVEVPTDKEGLMAYLNTLALNIQSADSMRHELLSEVSEEQIGRELERRVSEPDKPSYTEQSVDIDERFNQLPLAHQLSLAALALERARYQLPAETSDNLLD